MKNQQLMTHEGNLLKKLIKEYKCTQTQIAEEIGMNRSQFNILLNKSIIKEEVVTKVCQVLGVSPEHFFKSKMSQEDQGVLKKENALLKEELKALRQFKMESLQEQKEMLLQINQLRDQIDHFKEDKINLLQEMNDLLKKLAIYKQLQNQQVLD